MGEKRIEEVPRETKKEKNLRKLKKWADSEPKYRILPEKKILKERRKNGNSRIQK